VGLVSPDSGVPIEQFIQAITGQLDRAQAALALKARFGTPLTFAVRDLSIDLRTHIDVVDDEIVLRPAGPDETDTSVIHLSLTTITKPMIEENTRPLSTDDGGPSIRDALGDELTPDEQRKLEWAGVYTVSQLRDLPRQASPEIIERVSRLPASRLRAALTAATRPKVTEVRKVSGSRQDQLVINGINLAGGQPPRVHLEGNPLDVISATPHEIRVAAPPALALAGALDIVTDDGTASYAIGEPPP
jgi:hypothetical protein